MSFILTDEQEEFRGLVKRFADEVIAPRADELNAEGVFPVDIVQQMGELGLFAIPFAEADGGMGADLTTLCLAIEEIGRVDQSLGITLEAAVGLGATPIAEYGTDEQKLQWLGDLLTGQRVAGFGLTEPGGGSDVVGATRTTAEVDGDHWVVNGSKVFITNAGTDITSVVTVLARTGEDADGRPELTSIVVPADTPGFSVAPKYRKVGWHASDTREVILDDVRVPLANTLGERGEGFRQFLATLDDGRIAISALAVGLIQGCIDECTRYANEREAFGTPIGSNQAIAFKIADMEVAAHTARLATHEAAWRRDNGLDYKRQACIAKLYSSEAAVSAAREAAQVFGGYGFMTEYRVGRFYQDAKILEIGEGTSEVQRMLIARDLGVGTS
ncbi:acyl-CoA dehydrogenase family protein [Salsipaludibacter albus]|uniref:acyl-CoA dehydrogenase family protein n=1 Tax=Salsipaludibacter albus TaxID=2849650 RepID=UPI001EE472ED|nr:acyl-CoA dehydrogenase family protein [Salsipaludibacter albus]